jgi:putative oxidoreductase
VRTLLQTSGGWASFILRITLGIVFLAHGAQMTLGCFGGHLFGETVASFEKMGLPPLIAALVILAQFLGGIGLLVGLLTRVAAFGILAVMLGAIFLIHIKVGFFMNWSGQQRGEGYEFHLLAIAIAVVLMITGAGNLSLDKLISARSTPT